MWPVHTGACTPLAMGDVADYNGDGLADILLVQSYSSGGHSYQEHTVWTGPGGASHRTRTFTEINLYEVYGETPR